MARVPASLSKEEMEAVYKFADEVPLSRAKKNIARDFSDGGNLSAYSYTIN